MGDRIKMSDNTQSMEDIESALHEVKDAIAFADNGSYFAEIRDQLKELNKTMVQIADCLAEMSGDKNPRNRPPVGI